MEEHPKIDQGLAEGSGVCSICLEVIPIEETALVQACEHGFCVTCILRWASYNKNPSCPMCKQPFESLNVHRSLDGRLHDFMFAESVCLLLRAPWFVPLTVDDAPEEPDIIDHYYYDDDDEHDVETYSMSSIRIGNRRWGDNGYVRAGRKEARPLNRQSLNNSDAGPSRAPKQKEEVTGDAKGRRAKRAQKREAADKAAAASAAAKHQVHLERLGRK